MGHRPKQKARSNSGPAGRETTDSMLHRYRPPQALAGTYIIYIFE